MRFNLSYEERRVWEHAKYIFSYVFQTLLILFLIVLLVKEFYPSFIDTRINVSWFMLIVIVFGALSILFPVEKTERKEEFNLRDKLLIIGLGVLGAAIIFLKLKELGWIGYVISILGGLIIALLSWLLLTENDEH